MLFNDLEALVLPGDIPLEFRAIPPVPVQEQALASGQPLSFLMGSRGKATDEEPRHRVIIPEPFYLGVTPVTQAQFEAWTRSREYREWLASRSDEKPHQNQFAGHPQRPAENLTWYAARGFTEWLNHLVDTGRIGLPSGMRARLPDEGRWEYACRAGSLTEYWNGDGEERLREIGWYGGNSSETADVGRLPANPWGLHDMHGNVWEWCADAWDGKAYAQRPDGWVAGAWVRDGEEDPVRVMRGGSWFSSARGCRSAYRNWWRPLNRNRGRGFRVLLSSPGPAAEPGSQ